MNRFPENLSLLRRQAGYTQESLAEAMGVSRQAVSKWESGQAMPEAATLVDLADLLDCSLDQLMRQELSGLEPQEAALGEDGSSQAEQEAAFQAYAAHMDRFSMTIATGVALVLVGVAALLMAYGWLGNTALVVLPLFVFLAGAVFLFVWGGISHDDFQKTHPDVPILWTQEEREGFRRLFRLGMALAVAGVLADVALMVLLVSRAGGQEAAQVRAVALFMTVLAGCVWIFVYLGIQEEKMSGRAAAKEPDDPLSGVIMMSATILFLLAGFIWGRWHPAWVVFPVGGILWGIVDTVRNK